MTEGSNNGGAGVALKDSINAITAHIGSVVIKKIKDEFFDPFQLNVQHQLGKMDEQLSEAKATFNQNVLEAVRANQRKILEERIQQFNVDDIVKKLTEIPESISRANRALQAAIVQREQLKKSFEAVMLKLSTAASQSGLQPQNADDTKAIASILEEAVRNVDKYGESVNINYQSTGRDKLSLSVKDLDITEARRVHKALLSAEKDVVEAQIVFDELHNTFSALKRIVSVITAVSG